MKSDLEIARAAKPRDIGELAKEAGFLDGELFLFGRTAAKIGQGAFERLSDRPDGKLVLVTAINPTPAGEGKTTTTVGLADALRAAGKNAVAAIREPSLGPVFGMKGGAAGGGYAQVLPMEEINLHFTGDIHAVGAANNLLCALTDNHLYQGNGLNINPDRVVFRRAIDMNDRALRAITAGLHGGTNGVTRESGFDITAASEVMAILCMASDMADLEKRLAGIVCAYNRDGAPVFAGDLHAQGAMAALLSRAIDPNLVQTLEGTPAFVHGGPFANIAHGCSSVRATRLALKSADITVTEAGFGSDLGAEKFFDIKCRAAGLAPDAVVLVATVRALKYNGGTAVSDLAAPDTEALARGLANLEAHLDGLSGYGLPVVVAINRFASDSAAELGLVAELCRKKGAKYALSEVFSRGSAGGAELAAAVLGALSGPKPVFTPNYPLSLGLAEKIEAVAARIYGAAGVDYSPKARAALDAIEQNGFGGLPVCIAKTQYSLSDDPAKLCRPSGFRLNVADARVSAGAGFVVVLTGKILTMPGLPSKPAAEGIGVGPDGRPTGIF